MLRFGRNRTMFFSTPMFFKNHSDFWEIITFDNLKKIFYNAPNAGVVERQTQGTQNPPGNWARVGSNPTSGTIKGENKGQLERVRSLS